MRLLSLVFFAASLQARIWTVLTTGGDFSPVNQAQIQAALSNVSLACGDEIQIEAGTSTAIGAALTFNADCAPGSEVTLTTTMKSWLPDHTMRITPSYTSLLPLLYRLKSYSSCPACPLLNVSTLNGATRGIIVRGIAFQNEPYQNGDSSYSVFMLNFGQEGVCDIGTTFASGMTAEHLLFLSSSATSRGLIGGAINISGRNMSYLNSWSNDTRGFQEGTADVYGVISRNGGSGYNIVNNHSGSAATEHVIIGVGNPNCQTSGQVPTDLAIEHNHFYNSLKWFPNTASYVGLTAWMKNFFECKSCDTVKLRWNTGENQWMGVGGGQWYACTLTPRMSRDQSGCIAGDSSATTPAPHPLRLCLSGGGATVKICYLNADTTYHTCTVAAGADHCVYNYPPGWAIGGGISTNTVASPPTIYSGWETTLIDGVTDQFNLHVSPAFTSTANMGHGAGIGLYFDISNVINRAQNIVISGNYWKSTVMDGLIVLRDGACGPQPNIGTTGGNIQYFNNLHVDSETSFMNDGLGINGITWGVLNHFYLGGLDGYYGDNIQFQNNTRYQTATAAQDMSPSQRTAKFMVFNPNLFTQGPLTYNSDGSAGSFGGLKINNNLLLPSATINSLTPSTWAAQVTDTSAAQLLNNPANGAYAFSSQYAACPIGSRACASPANFFGYPPETFPFTPYWQDAPKNRYIVDPGNSIYYASGSDGKDVGVDMRSVEAIQGLTVTTTDVAAWFQLQLPNQLCGWPVQIEVSSDPHLTNDLGTYTVVNALRPDFFIRSDSDQVNSRATANGCMRTFMVGDSATVTGDDGLSHNLRLSASTLYYYRINAGGAQERGSFTTTAAVTPPPFWTIRSRSTGGTTRTHMRLCSAATNTGALNPSNCAAAVSCASGCNLTLTPDANSRQMVYYLAESDSGGTIAHQTGPYVQFVR